VDILNRGNKVVLNPISVGGEIARLRQFDCCWEATVATIGPLFNCQSAAIANASPQLCQRAISCARRFCF
jgi:hypothetical protein